MKASCFSAVLPVSGLEPVRVVRRAALDRPVLHRRGDDVGDFGIERLGVLDRALDVLEDVLGQAGLHGAFGEDVDSEVCPNKCFPDVGRGSPRKF
jgi:hypothetical protein